MSKQQQRERDEPTIRGRTLDEHVREHEQRIRELAEEDDDLGPVIEAMLADVLGEGGG